MASPRFFAPSDMPVAYYHLISRVVDRRFVFEDEERENFVRLMRAYEAFCQVRVVTYCAMSNHFHILAEVRERPQAQVYSDEWVLKQVSFIYAPAAVRDLREALQALRRQGGDAAAEELKERYLGRMWDVSQFMKELKQRFSLWFNKRTERKGTLWEERFTSVLVDGEGAALATVSAYIDLNPVRAGIVQDPKDYRWCGYAECVAGGRKALEGLSLAWGCFTYGGARTRVEKLEAYRLWLFELGEERVDAEAGEVLRKGIKAEKVAETQKRKGKLGRGEMLRCRVRYFTQGAVIGSRDFVDSVFNKCRERFGERRQDGARVMRGADFGGLCAMRDLRAAVIAKG